MIALRTSALILLFTVLGIANCSAEPLTFQRAIQLALSHSPAIGIAAADQAKAEKALSEVRGAFKPTVVIGSGLGWSYGFPMSIEGSAPSIFQVAYQSALYNPSLSEFSKSARLEASAAGRTLEDQRKDVILDTAVTYIQLDDALSELKSLRVQQDEASKLSTIVSQRVQQGVDSQIELTRARLLAARVRLRIMELEGNADVLREKLSKATAITAPIETVSDSIPKFPEVDQTADLGSKALDNSSSVKAATEHAQAQKLKAAGEWKALRPSLDIVGQYGLFAKFNNYEDFFRKFQRNNATLGVAVKFPIFNFAQRAHAEQADAEATRAERQVEVVKNQVSEETLRLQRAVRQLGAAQEVAQLEYELAQSEAQATEIRAESGAAAPQNPDSSAAPVTTVTARDISSSRLQAGDRFSQYMSSTLEYNKARLQLLRLTGELEAWAGTAK